MCRWQWRSSALESSSSSPLRRFPASCHRCDDTKETPMTDHMRGTREEWLAARLELLKAEKEHTRRGDELASMRQALPWVRVDKDYRFETDEGSASLTDL